MLSYFKILTYLFSLNIFIDKNKKLLPTDLNVKSYSNVNQVVSNIYRSLNILNVVSKQCGTILFVGTTREMQKLSYFFSFKIKRTFFITKWLNGFLTNWSFFKKFVTVFTQPSFSRVNKSKKLRFFRFFSKFLNQKKPDIVVFINPSDINISSMLFECFLENIPTIVFSEQQHRQITYFIPVNTHNFYSHWFFFQLFLGQQNNNILCLRTLNDLNFQKNLLLIFLMIHVLYIK